MVQGRRAATAALGVAIAVAAAVPAVASDVRVIAVDGVAKGNKDRRVEVLVAVPAGESARAAGDRALAGQGAVRAPKKPEPPASSGYTFTGLVWDRLPVVQSYNPAGEPTTAARTALTNTYGDW